jgi:hypothetical protein
LSVFALGLRTKKDEEWKKKKEEEKVKGHRKRGAKKRFETCWAQKSWHRQ